MAHSMHQFLLLLHKYSLIRVVFDEVQHHTQDDDLLLRLLVWLSCEEDIDVVLEYAPAHIYAIHFSQICQDKYEKLTKDKVRNSV